MKILWILGELPIPADSGGKLRVLGLLKELAPRHEITVVVLDPGETESHHLAELRALCHRVEVLPWQGRRSKLQLILGAICHLFSHLPFAVIKYCSEETERKLTQLLSAPYDLVQCESFCFYRYLSHPTTAKKILNTQNIEAAIWQQRAQLCTNPFLRFYLNSQARKMAQYESWIIEKYDSVLAVSDEDAAILKTRYRAKSVAVVPNGVEVFALLPGLKAEPGLIVFSGAMDYTPNDDAMHYFLRDVWPLIVQKYPAARFKIVGRRPSRTLRAMVARHTNVEITGWVEEVRPFLARAAVVVVPLRMGGGTRIKILEAMALGKPIVSTSIGAENLGVVPEQHLLLADTPLAFIEKTVFLLENSDLGRKIGQTAREFVEANYSWRICARRLNEIWQKNLQTK